MTTSEPFLIAVSALAAALAAHFSARFLSRQPWLVEAPSARSSHRRPTPRTGGVALALGVLAGTVIIVLAEPALLKFAGLFVVAFALGFIDDVRPLPAALKLLGQIVIAALFVWMFGAVSSIPAPVLGDLPLGVAAPALTVFWIVAFMNAFNFMDGANGIAASAAIFALSALGVAAAGAGADAWAATSIILASATFGYLPLNFPKAQLFMGDGGSQSIGFSIASLAVLASSDSGGAVSALFIPTVFMPFLFDVAFTLAHRIARRRHIADAHKEHLYQLLMRLGASHAAVTSIYLGLVAISTLAAIFAGSLPASLQFAAPAGLFAILLLPALIVFRKAESKGLLAELAGRPRSPAAALAKAAE